MNRLTIAGLGIKNLIQMTVETRNILLEANKVLYLGTNPEEHIKELKSWGVQNICSILDRYIDGEIDENNYQRIYNAVIEATLKYEQVILLIPGHPRIGVSLVQKLTSTDLAAQVTVLPGISSFDTMINDLKRDPLEKGSVIVDANRVLLFSLKWPSHLDCYIYHICSIGTRRVHLHNAQKDNAWFLLKEHLLKIYSPDKKVDLINSAMTETNKSCVRSINLSAMEELLPYIHFGTSLFIGGDKSNFIDKTFLKLLMTGARHA